MIGTDRLVIMFGFFKLNFIVYLICVVWLIILIIAPLVEPENTIHFSDSGDLDRVGEDEHYYDIEELQNTFSKIVYHSGDRMCHMKESRSFSINENQMPYCARCFGIFLGFAIGAAIASFVLIDLRWWMLVIGLGPIGLDGGLQLITSYESNNIFRLLTGLLAGIITMIAVGLMIMELSNMSKQWMINRIWAKKYRNSYKIISKK